MRKLLFLIPFLAILGCGETGEKKEIEKVANVEVYYFHGKHRCPTCIAIEEVTKATLEKYFAEQTKNKTVVFIPVDMSKDENMDLIEKFEVTSSSLIIRYYKDDKEKIENLTEFGFMNAVENPEKLENKIKEVIESSL